MSKRTPGVYKQDMETAERNLKTSANPVECLKTQAAKKLGVDVEDVEWLTRRELVTDLDYS